ncbi:YibE/F family protein [Actinoplanes rectilineatus]|uniref:YibE/F family protein n=1 Tax=Actinoplanes rectilineatus TaxID=113571 RepID=UPI0007C772BC|nr:YibE/F family protein [Actinoplanes rectilineatus]
MSAGHTHTTADADDNDLGRPHAGRLTIVLLVPAAIIIAVAMILLWPAGIERDPAAPDDRVNGTVTAVQPVDCATEPEIPGPAGEEGSYTQDSVCGSVTVKVTSGASSGSTVTTDIPAGPGAVTVEAGDDIELLYLPDSPTGQAYSIYDHQRSTQLWILAAAFAAAVIAFGRWRGLSALAGLAVTFAVLLWFIVPAILEGRSPLLIAIVGSAAIMLTVLYLTHGLHMGTTVAVAGTLAALTITGVLSALSTGFTHLTGISDETSNYLNITHADVNMQGLLLAGIVIGSLGVLDDVTVTQSAAVSELARANPAYGFRQLYRAAERIGRAHIASVINTIVLAYAGASLPLMLLFAAGNEPIGATLTTPLIAQELVRSIVGTLGLIAAVSITTALAAATAGRPRGTREKVKADRSPGKQGAPADPWMAFVDGPDGGTR